MRFCPLLFLSLQAAAGFVVQKGPISARAGGSATIDSATQLYERKPYITGNWKLNPQTKAEAADLAEGIAAAVTSDSPCDVALFVPFPFIETVKDIVGDKLEVGAEVGF